MKSPVALLGRILLVAPFSVIFAVAPLYAQNAGGGGMGGHGGGGSHGGGSHGGGSHGGGSAHGGAPAGGGHSGPAGGVRAGSVAPHAGGTPMPGPAMPSGSASHSESSSPNWGRNVFVPPNASTAERAAPLPAGSMHRATGPIVWQKPPAPYPSRVALSPARWASMRPGSTMMVRAGTPFSAAPAARSLRSVSVVTAPMGARVGSQVFAGMVPQPRGFFFHHRHFCDTNFFFFGFGFRHFGFFGGFPFQQCFFNGFTSVCAIQPVFFSPFGFGPFGFGDVGWGWSGSGTGYQNTVATQPAEQQPAETGPPNDYSTYQPGTAPEPLPQEQANASPLILLVLKDGTVYGVTDYWLEEGRLHYLTSYGGANDISIDQLDLQKTVDQNWARGVEFVLRPANK